jgi:cellulose synthase/poly-beta-1,6-N-acetylglucosamine synthase-like glycosyltransferase/phosphoglycerol transferase MdoB-like AlkP superfamily enzyme
MNWQNISDIIFNLFVYGIFYYSVVLVWSYIFIGIFSIGETNRYVHKNSFTDYRLLAASPHAPSVTVIAPAHNEGKTIIENVRSLLSIYYSNLEVIFLNDGSTDDSLEKLITAYELEKVDFFVNYQIPTKEVIGVYKSRNPIYSKLVVVDKVNGGKADALNVGVNIATNDYLICIDVDCVLEEDALLKMVKPFLEETNTKVIASGGVIRIANSCIIEDGKLVKVKIPKQILPRMQSLEYIRSFILGRMAWSRLNGLLIVSGAFGAFNKEIVIKAGGYNHNTVGEDMELIVRMRRYMESKKLKYKVTYIPDPLCWTEAPVSFKILGRQRNRWARGTYETLKFHRAMFMNPKFHIMGLLSYPYWLFFEFCAPIIEFFGFAFFFLFAVLGMIDWWFFFIYLVFVLFFGYLYSVFAIYMEIITYNQYKKRSEITLLILTALTEPFYFHPFVVWSAVKGYFDLIRNNRGWGEMTRTGFEVYKPKLVVEKEEVDVLKERNWVYAKIHKIPVAFFNAIEEYSSYAIVLLLLLLASRIFELAHEVIQHSVPKLFSDVIGLGLVKDVSYFLSTGLLWFVPFLLLYLLNKKTARIFFVALSACLILIQISLSQYFITTSVPLGSDLWGYSWNDIKQTVGAAGVINAAMIIGISFLLAIIIFSFAYLPKKIKVNGFLAVILFVLFGSALWLNLISITDKWVPGQEYSNNLALNKSSFFLEASLQHFFPADKQPDIYTDAYSGNYASNENGTTSFNNGTFKYVDEVNYPFLHTIDSSADVLSPFFTIGKTPPNFVIIFVEGLGRAFTNKGGYLGNFTPFIDSLSEKSLYWENFLSEGGRTFAVLPSFLGSLPFGKNGFNELGENMPQHLSLLSLLKHNGYNTSFSYGGDSRFDNMNVYMQKNNVNSINDESSFPSGYIKMPPSQSGFSWGYGDKELFRRFLETKENPQQPFASVVLTVSTHSPFGINEQETYLQRFEQRMNELGFDDQKKREYRGYKNNYASILFMDDAVKNFIDQYKKRPDFNNTVFIITGDHRMPEIPMSTKLDRYHVPLVIYSPLIKRSAKFSSISTHFDVAPSLLMWLKKSYGLQIPSIVNFVGSGLDTARRFRNTHAYPLMQTKTDLIDFVKGEYMINGNNLFRINSNMDLTPVEDKAKFNELKAAFDLFKRKNEQFIQGKKLMPDSLVQKYLK